MFILLFGKNAMKNPVVLCLISGNLCKVSKYVKVQPFETVNDCKLYCIVTDKTLSFLLVLIKLWSV